jgi:hypothetical protein
MSAHRIAFLILAHRDAQQVERLCSSLAPHPIFLHVDLRSTSFPMEDIAALPGLTIVEPRTAVYWSDFSMVDATLTALKLARARGPFDRYVLLSGECYPVKPLEDITAAFREDPQREWIGLTPIKTDSHLYTLISRHWRIKPLLPQRTLDTKLRRVWNKLAKLRKRDLKSEIGMAPCFGNSWWALTDSCVSMILEVLEAKPELIRAYRSVYAPDEQLFHTIINKSEFSAQAMQVEDVGDATNQITPLHEVSGAGDRRFRSTEEDFRRAASTSKFFIRKVSTELSGPLLDSVDKQLL